MKLRTRYDGIRQSKYNQIRASALLKEPFVAMCPSPGWASTYLSYGSERQIPHPLHHPQGPLNLMQGAETLLPSTSPRPERGEVRGWRMGPGELVGQVGGGRRCGWN